MKIDPVFPILQTNVYKCVSVFFKNRLASIPVRRRPDMTFGLKEAGFNCFECFIVFDMKDVVDQVDFNNTSRILCALNVCIQCYF